MDADPASIPATDGEKMDVVSEKHSTAEQHVPPSPTSPKQKAKPTVVAKKTLDFDPEEYELRKRLPPRLLPTRHNDIYVTRRTAIPAQLSRARKLLALPGEGYHEVWIHGLGASLNRALQLALQLKREHCGSVELDSKTSTVAVTDELMPMLVDDGEISNRTRFVSAIHIRMFRPRVPVEKY